MAWWQTWTVHLVIRCRKAGKPFLITKPNLTIQNQTRLWLVREDANNKALLQDICFSVNLYWLFPIYFLLSFPMHLLYPQSHQRPAYFSSPHPHHFMSLHIFYYCRPVLWNKNIDICILAYYCITCITLLRWFLKLYWNFFFSMVK